MDSSRILEVVAGEISASLAAVLVLRGRGLEDLAGSGSRGPGRGAKRARELPTQQRETLLPLHLLALYLLA